MIRSILLLSCALTLSQGADRADWVLTPQLVPGLELVYNGTYVEESLIPNVQHQRVYHLEANVLVLDASITDWQVAVMTTLSLQDGRQAPAKKDGPSSVRLELGRIDLQSRIRGNDKKRIDIPLQGPPTLESGFVVPAPLVKVGRNSTWDIAEPGQPTQRWQVIGPESCGGVTCLKVVGIQQSLDWNNPRADQSAWRRRDTVWLFPQVNVAQKVERIIERKDPARDAPTFRMVVRYELDSRLRYPTLLLEERRKEVLKAAKFNEETQPLLRHPANQRAQIDGLIQRVSFHLAHQPATQTTPYRKAVLHLKTVLEKAQKGEIAVPSMANEPPALPRTVGVGARVNDFAVSSFTQERAARLQDFKGRPILVVFYNPATPLGQEVLTHVKRLSDRHKDALGIMAMAATQDADLVRKQHRDWKLAFPILDGNGMRLTFGAEQTPHFVVVDSNGLVRLMQTGWGIQTPAEIDEALQRCVK